MTLWSRYRNKLLNTLSASVKTRGPTGSTCGSTDAELDELHRRVRRAHLLDIVVIVLADKVRESRERAGSVVPNTSPTTSTSPYRKVA